MSEKTKTVKRQLAEKLTSRKFWAAILAAAGAVVCALMGERMNGEEMEALRCGVTALIAYIFGEGAIDLARIVTDAFGKKAE